MIDFKKEEAKYNQILAIKKALAEHQAYNVIRQAHIDLMYHFNKFYTVNMEVALNSTNQINILWHNIGYIIEYDTIADKVTEITYDNSINAQFTKTYQYKDVTFRISDYLNAKIPEEELALLELLGKVEITITEAQPSKVEKTIFCPNNSTTPLLF